MMRWLRELINPTPVFADYRRCCHCGEYVVFLIEDHYIMDILSAQSKRCPECFKVQGKAA